VSVVANGLQPYCRNGGASGVNVQEVTEAELIQSIVVLQGELRMAKKDLEVAASRFSQAERNLNQCSQKLLKLRGLQLVCPT
jgi:hypothetical protein